jgi:hypothetical protein
MEKLYREHRAYPGSRIKKCELAARVEKFVDASLQK